MFCVASLNYLQLNLYRLTFFSARVSSFTSFFIFLFTHILKYSLEKNQIFLWLSRCLSSFCCINNYNMFCFVFILFPQPNFSELTLNL